VGRPSSLKPLWFAAFLWTWVVSAPLSAASAAKAAPVHNKLALGVPVAGAQIHWGFASKWALEARFLQGKAESETDEIKSNVFGLRLYRYLNRPLRWRFFWGLEVAKTDSQSDTSTYETTGTALGGFIGTEFYLARRLSVGMDVGPYAISSETRGGTTDSEIDTVINAFMNFYLL
jgi:hypothetical protein